MRLLPTPFGNVFQYLSNNTNIRIWIRPPTADSYAASLFAFPGRPADVHLACRINLAHKDVIELVGAGTEQHDDVHLVQTRRLLGKELVGQALLDDLCNSARTPHHSCEHLSHAVSAFTQERGVYRQGTETAGILDADVQGALNGGVGP